MVNEKMRKESETGVARPLFSILLLMFHHESTVENIKKEGEDLLARALIEDLSKHFQLLSHCIQRSTERSL